MKRSKGLTLIEWLVFIAIVLIMAAFLWPVFSRAKMTARGQELIAQGIFPGEATVSRGEAVVIGGSLTMTVKACRPAANKGLPALVMVQDDHEVLFYMGIHDEPKQIEIYELACRLQDAVGREELWIRLGRMPIKRSDGTK